MSRAVNILRLLLLILCAVECNSILAATTLPQPIPGWKIDLVAESPKIKHPSVVACAPDGRIFVAEDPMDISLPNANAAEGRILCFHPDGRTTVFAEKLYAVFGLQYLEGKVYVLHNPKFSVFDDDNGVGKNRRELIEQTLPDPSALNWNDHIPANFKLAMDGYFYVAAGDKGLHGAVGTDGSRADLFSGGVFRIKPDGSKLEVFSHGVRNILDVALNAEDEIFTYDNTDEHDWMGRVTHMVEAGFYGYPHDFIPQRPYTLWMLADLGPGAACGAFAYNQDALPPEYDGNLFLSDFGKRQVMRVVVKRDGPTYKFISKEDLFPNPPGDFRPVGITLSPDGRSIYICDWQHRDEKANVTVGRLLKLTWTGKDHSAPKPNWFIPAASGKRFDASIESLTAGLFHSSHSVRLTAQRRLSEREDSASRLSELALDRNLPGTPRIHAISALANHRDQKAFPRSAAGMLSDSNPFIRKHAIRTIGVTGRMNQGQMLNRAITDSDPSVRFHAVTTLGKLGGAAAVPPLVKSLSETNFFNYYAVFTALNRIGTNQASAWRPIVNALSNETSRVSEGASYALRETYDEELAKELSTFLNAKRPLPARQRAAELLVAMLHKPPAWKGEWWGYHPALQPPPKKTEPWMATPQILAALRANLNDPAAEIRRLCIEGLSTSKDPAALSALRDAFPQEGDPATKATILKAFAAAKDPMVGDFVSAELNTPSHPDLTSAAIAAAADLNSPTATSALLAFLQGSDPKFDQFPKAIEALASLKHEPAVPTIVQLLCHQEANIRGAAVRALAALQSEAALPQVERALEDPVSSVRLAAVQALANLKTTNATPALMRAYAAEDIRAEAFRALARTPDSRALNILLDELGSKNPANRNLAHLAVRDLAPKVLPQVEARVNTLPPTAVGELRHIYAGNPGAERGPIFSSKIEERSIDEYFTAALSASGDPLAGAKLFNDPIGVNCLGCHRVAGQGSTVGPDLSNIGAQFDRRALAESIIYPSKAVREGYQQTTLELNDEQERSGLIKGETAEAVTLVDVSGQAHVIPRDAIKNRVNSALSLMPEGLHAALSLQDFTDLIAYLATLKMGN